jgi:hypothetical protein
MLLHCHINMKESSKCHVGHSGFFRDMQCSVSHRGAFIKPIKHHKYYFLDFQM